MAIVLPKIQMLVPGFLFCETKLFKFIAVSFCQQSANILFVKPAVCSTICHFGRATSLRVTYGGPAP